MPVSRQVNSIIMQQTHIQWADATVNFWTGCQKISPGCFNCYMFRDKAKYGQNPKVVSRTKDATFKSALKWKDSKKIFTCSWSDFFIDVSDPWRKDAWDVIRQTPHHTWQILTKRPDRILQCLPSDWGNGWDNVWLGVSIESQNYMSRAYTLASVPAKTRFISAEPLLDEIDFTKTPSILNKFNWCIIGGESGNDKGKHLYRPCDQLWIEKIINDLQGTSVEVFVKQMGTHLAKQMKLKDRHGGEISEWPSHLQIRNMP